MNTSSEPAESGPQPDLAKKEPPPQGGFFLPFKPPADFLRLPQNPLKPCARMLLQLRWHNSSPQPPYISKLFYIRANIFHNAKG